MRITRIQKGCVFCCAVLLIFISSQLCAQQNVAPPEVIKAAESGLDLFLNNVFQNQKSKAHLGFKENDARSQAHLGKPLQLHLLNSNSIANYAKDDNVKSFLTPSNKWFFPVLIAGEGRSVLTVAKINGAWKAVGLGKAALSKEIDGIRRVWSQAKGYDPILAFSPEAKTYMFNIPQYNSTNLTVIAAPTKDNIAKDYSKLENSADLIKKLGAIGNCEGMK